LLKLKKFLQIFITSKLLIIILFIINLVILLLLTLAVGCLPLLERKILSLLQRRVGPLFVGYKGRLQYIADALKLFLKKIQIPNSINKTNFILFPSLVLGISYSIWIIVAWGPNIIFIDTNFNLILFAILSFLTTLNIIFTGYFSKNKYAILASVRASMGLIHLELFMGLYFLFIFLTSKSFNFNYIVSKQINLSNVFILSPAISLIFFTFLLETNRTPFDLSEAESELISGFHVEYGGFFFGLYYLGEYTHLFFFSLVTSILIFGGWGGISLYLVN
jgi:NADH:ubiquinone oxidoreductase subunit H